MLLRWTSSIAAFAFLVSVCLPTVTKTSCVAAFTPLVQKSTPQQHQRRRLGVLFQQQGRPGGRNTEDAASPRRPAKSKSSSSPSSTPKVAPAAAKRAAKAAAASAAASAAAATAAAAAAGAMAAAAADVPPASAPAPAPATPKPPKREILRTFRKTDLINALQSRHGNKLTKRDADLLVSSVLEIIMENVDKQQKVHLGGFGTFSLLHRAARKGRNPQTGEEMSLPATETPKFTVAKGWKDAANGKTGKEE